MNRRSLAAALLCFVMAAVPGRAAPAPVTFAGKTINVLIDSDAGGGTDASARYLGTALVKYLPGRPAVVFRNMPGGGGLKAANYFYREVRPDGLTLLVGSRTQISPAKMLSGAARYNPAEFVFVGGDERLGTVILVRADARSRLTDKSARPLIYGDIDGSRSGVMASLWGKEFLGWNLRHVVGYSGTPALILAARSGELQMLANQNAFTVKPLLESGAFVAIAQMGVRNEQGGLERRSTFPDVPLFADLLLPKLDARARRAYEQMQADLLVNKWIALPPRAPAAIVAAHRLAFAQATKDADFLKVVRNEIGGDYAPMTGEQLKSVVEVLVKMTPSDLDFINALKRKNGLPLE